MNQIKEVVESGSIKEELKESKAATRLSKRVNSMMEQLHDQLDKLHAEKAELQVHILDHAMKRTKKHLSE